MNVIKINPLTTTTPTVEQLQDELNTALLALHLVIGGHRPDLADSEVRELVQAQIQLAKRVKQLAGDAVDAAVITASDLSKVQTSWMQESE